MGEIEVGDIVSYNPERSTARYIVLTANGRVIEIGDINNGSSLGLWSKSYFELITKGAWNIKKKNKGKRYKYEF